MKQLTYTKEETGVWPCLVLDFGHDVWCISLHGDGERGNDLGRVLLVGPQYYCVNDFDLDKGYIGAGHDYGVNFICPQCEPNKAFWKKPMEKFVKWCVNEISKGLPYSSDPKMGITGISMGGNKTWEAAQIYPWLFLAPVAGRPEKPKGVWEPYVPLRDDCQIYAAHSPHDKKVPIDKDLALVQELSKAWPGGITHRWYDNIHDHNVWDEFYKPGGEFDRWLKSILNGSNNNEQIYDDEDYLSLILTELRKAEKKHPSWPNDLLHQMAIVNEESGEATRAALHVLYEKGSIENLETELIQTAAMCVRMLKNLPNQSL